MMTHEELEEAVPLYAVGALERPERQALEAHLLSGCATCHAALKDYQGVAALLPFTLPPVAPPSELKAKVLAARNPSPPPIEETRQSVKPSLEPGEWMNHLFPPITPARSWPFQLAFGLLSLVLFAGAGYFAWTAHSRSTREVEQTTNLREILEQETSKTTALQRDIIERENAIKQLRDELDVRRADLTELRDQVIQRDAELDDLRSQLAQRAVRQQDEFAGLLKSPSSKVIALSGTERAKQAGGFVLFDPTGKKAWLYAFDLPDLPAGTVYQLWAIDEKPFSMGFFTLDTGRKGRLLIKGMRNVSKLKQIAISIEPAGGRPQPSGAVYLLSQTS
ncbi:anti-sigma factor domain-containing protein [Nitrospira sp. Nam80]